MGWYLVGFSVVGCILVDGLVEFDVVNGGVFVLEWDVFGDEEGNIIIERNVKWYYY